MESNNFKIHVLFKKKSFKATWRRLLKRPVENFWSTKTVTENSFLTVKINQMKYFSYYGELKIGMNLCNILYTKFILASLQITINITCAVIFGKFPALKLETIQKVNSFTGDYPICYFEACDNWWYCMRNKISLSTYIGVHIIKYVVERES